MRAAPNTETNKQTNKLCYTCGPCLTKVYWKCLHVVQSTICKFVLFFELVIKPPANAQVVYRMTTICAQKTVTYSYQASEHIPQRKFTMSDEDHTMLIISVIIKGAFNFHGRLVLFSVRGCQLFLFIYFWGWGVGGYL